MGCYHYEQTNGIVTIAAGSTTGGFTIRIMNDLCRQHYFGGGEIYRLALENNLVERIYLTRIHKTFVGDTFFPTLSEDWKLIRSETNKADVKHECDFTFEVYEKTM